MNPEARKELPAGLRIRVATADDAALITKLGADTFVASFGAQNTPENLAKHIAGAYSEEIQRRELADPAVTYLIAEQYGRTAGYAQVREGDAPECVTGSNVIEVRRFYVVHEFHGSGIAQALMDACADEARRRRAYTLWLGVWEQNPRAIRFYTKCGFQDVGTQTFMLGDDPQQDRVLCWRLEASEG